MLWTVELVLVIISILMRPHYNVWYLCMVFLVSGYIKFCAQLSTARRKAPRNLAWCGRGSNPGPLARRCQQSHDTHVGLSSYRLRHWSLGQKSYSEWHILWDGDNLSSSGLREEREVYLAQAVMIFVWSGTRLNTSLGSPRYDLSVWGYSVNWFHDTTRHADTFCFCEDMAGEILRIIVALPVLFSTGSITIIRRCASIVKAPVSRWWCSACKRYPGTMYYNAPIRHIFHQSDALTHATAVKIVGHISIMCVYLYWRRQLPGKHLVVVRSATGHVHHVVIMETRAR